jgi:hypothetical protein
MLHFVAKGQNIRLGNMKGYGGRRHGVKGSVTWY